MISSKFTWKGIVRSSKPGVLSVGPTLYYLDRRVTKTGAYQGGMLGGFEMRFNRIKRTQFYWGGTLNYAAGSVRGKNRQGLATHSSVNDFDIQVRLGHTFSPWGEETFFIAPYVSWGYSRDINRSKEPIGDTLNIENRYQVPYVGLGFLQSRFYTKNFSWGINFEIRLIFDSKDEITYSTMDAWYDEQKQEIVIGEAVTRSKVPMGPQAQYYLEIPFIYQISGKERGSSIAWVPFYQFRHYGELIFNETCFQVGGLKFFYRIRF
jgi:hypothetical protein